MTHSLSGLTILVAVLLWAGLTHADDKAKDDKAKKDAPSATELKFDDMRIARVQGRLVGPGKHEYTFNARKGQKVALALSSDLSPWIGMDLLAPVFAPALKSAPPAVYTNFIDGSTRWEGIAPGDGQYTVRLGLMRSQAQRVGRVDYELDVNLK